ncbi:MAG: methyltransferase domain-containing protein [Deltaproteobacteria bacterium]|nr:MAG: methyltransferase domain-containing protein [Deltaproteobacteria bacterium]
MGGDPRARWDERHAAARLRAPDPLLLEAVDGVPPGRALDVACGLGRHALALAARGWRVTAVDVSPVAVERLRAEAARRGLARRIDAAVVDLEAEAAAAVLPPGPFDLVAVLYFACRPLWPALCDAVRPGGRVVTAAHVAPPGDRPHRYALAPGELAAPLRARGWRIVCDRLVAGRHRDRPAQVAQVIAIRPPGAP